MAEHKIFATIQSEADQNVLVGMAAAEVKLFQFNKSNFNTTAFYYVKFVSKLGCILAR